MQNAHIKGPPAPAPANGRDRILSAALGQFSTVGFDGTTLRAIAADARVPHQLIVHHFGTKDELWRVVVSELCAQSEDLGARALEIEKSEGPESALRLLITSFVAFTAAYPEFHRIMTFEGRAKSARLTWLHDNYVAEFYKLSTRLIRAAQRRGAVLSGHPGRLHYAMIGLVTAAFVFPAEYEAMTGLDSAKPSEAEAITALALKFMGLDGNP